ncbi:MAG: 4Fe-4S dicluster domain-containing protein [Pseudomonadota bacterium]
MAKAFLVDTTRCTACRGCQMACKDWHGLPANMTKQTGTHQNPPDMNINNYKIVRFFEHLSEDNRVIWNFFPDQCRHCEMPPCVDAANDVLEGSMYKDEETGAILVNQELFSQISEEDGEGISYSCPYSVPHYDAAKKTIAKCNMCIDRVEAGMPPACVRVCPTGAMQFGEREDIIEYAEKRLEVVLKEHPKAFLADIDDVSVIYLLAEEGEFYHEYASMYG